MTAGFNRVVLAGLGLAIAILCIGAHRAQAQSEYPPPSGKGPVVVVISGQSGAAHYESQAIKVAALGYDAILLDGNDLVGTGGKALQAAIQKAQSSPHGIPGKVGVVGFSLGGGLALGYASHWPDLVSVIVVWYPATSTIKNLTGFTSTIKVPVLMFAGGQDHYKECCLIESAETLAEGAKAKGTPLEVVIYQAAKHDFVLAGPSFDASDTVDSWDKAEAKLKQYLGH
jgi:hypothetical protein